MKFKIETAPRPPQCSERKGLRRSLTRCELPPGHHDYHLGRDTAGRWHSWTIALGETQPQQEDR